MRRLLLVLVIASPLFAAQAEAPAPLTQVETLRIENLRLSGIILTQEIAEFNAKRAALKADLESTREGWEWQPDTAKFTKKAAK